MKRINGCGMYLFWLILVLVSQIQAINQKYNTTNRKINRPAGSYVWSILVPSGAVNFYMHVAVVYNNQMYVIAGQSSASVASSSNGIVWTPVTQIVGYGDYIDRVYPAATVFNGMVVLTGGRTYSGTTPNNYADTATGLLDTWTSNSNSGVYRYTHAMFVLNSKVWAAGGQGGSVALMSSMDGLIWTAETSATTFPARTSVRFAVMNNAVYMLSGSQTDVWSSSDGINWIQVW